MIDIENIICIDNRNRTWYLNDLGILSYEVIRMSCYKLLIPNDNLVEVSNGNYIRRDIKLKDLKIVLTQDMFEELQVESPEIITDLVYIHEHSYVFHMSDIKGEYTLLELNINEHFIIDNTIDNFKLIDEL